MNESKVKDGGQPISSMATRACGIMRLDVGPEAVAATFLPGRLRKSITKSLHRDGDRVVFVSRANAKPFERINDFLEMLDEWL